MSSSSLRARKAASESLGAARGKGGGGPKGTGDVASVAAIAPVSAAAASAIMASTRRAKSRNAKTISVMRSAAGTLAAAGTPLAATLASIRAIAAANSMRSRWNAAGTFRDGSCSAASRRAIVQRGRANRGDGCELHTQSETSDRARSPQSPRKLHRNPHRSVARRELSTNKDRWSWYPG